MICPNCNSERTGVTDTLPGNDGNIYRRRKCRDCGQPFRSVELVIDDQGQYRYGYSEAHYRRHPPKSK